jgi:uncharacterized integral membrane protein
VTAVVILGAAAGGLLVFWAGTVLLSPRARTRRRQLRHLRRKYPVSR